MRAAPPKVAPRLRLTPSGCRGVSRRANKANVTRGGGEGGDTRQDDSTPPTTQPTSARKSYSSQGLAPYGTTTCHMFLSAYCSTFSSLMDTASLANVALVSALRTCVSTNPTNRSQKDSHCTLLSASCSQELAFPINSFVLNCLSSCAQCAWGLPLPTGLMCTVAAFWFRDPLFLAAFPAHFQ